MKKIFLTAAALTAIFVGIVSAQVPSEDVKVKALQCAYYLNGDSFRLSDDGRRPFPMIDLSKVDLDRCVAAASTVWPHLDTAWPHLENKGK